MMQIRGLPNLMARLFISQDRMDNWTVEDRIKVDDDVMTLQGDGRAFKIVPAVRFMKVAGGDADAHNLVGKVKTVEAVVAQGGEHYHDSVIMGDVAYDVQNGFMGAPIPAGG
jgi:hypothetical protein